VILLPGPAGGVGSFHPLGRDGPKLPPPLTYLLFSVYSFNQPVLAPWHQSQIEAPAIDEWFRHSEETWEAIHVRLQRAISRHKTSADLH
jgi:hypothetical protein